ncbi:MAG TPA: VCBS repeat-containing protein, partial [Candidatus Saccharimonadales bacterium]|nr:VCBS repeat-containing protein [Candidatus Saccharimonadales bacterium]
MRLPVAETGILFTNTVDETSAAANRVLEIGSGVAAGDFDGDGLTDLFFCSLSGACKLYRNLGGFRFKDVTAEAGIQCANRICMGAVFADIDGDGKLDLLISTCGHGVLCFKNDGDGHFTDVTRTAGTASPFGATTLALADIDGNGTLDLYVANYRPNDIRDVGQVSLQSVQGQLVVPPSLRRRLLLVDGKVQEYGEPDVLYLNDGSGHFTPASWVDGRFLDEQGVPLKHAPADWGLTAAFHDLNGDGFPDLYVCNDYWTPDRIWTNDGAGHFRAMLRAAMRHTSASSMGVDFADIDQDGHLDIFVVDMLNRQARKQLT